ncbi:GNAT family N-acetyltransferase [Streptomyces sp. NPDC006134]|uniref:GNAT family N-acetyltransferase n=1 Tax=Streptomyces sp. NPDC006134 TaxID=3154467 RepID=UPI0033F45AF2
MSVTVTPVAGRSDLTSFIRLPYALYRDDPLWVAPLERERRSFLDPVRNPYHRTAAVRLFLARRQGTVVGRIAAVVDPRFNERHDPHCGVIGLFECADDPVAAAALFDTADAWLAARGMRRTFGPLGLTTNDECGIQIAGHDQPHVLLIPRTRPYYPELFSRCGFRKAKDLVSYSIPMPRDGEPPADYRASAERVLATPGLTVRPMDTKRARSDLETVRDIYNATFEESYGSVPLGDAEFDYLAHRLKPLLRPGLLQIAEMHGEPVAFLLCLPDAHQALHAAHGRLTTFGLPLGLIRVARASRRVDRVRFTAMGVLKEHRSRGLATALLTQAQRAAFRLGHTEISYSWVLEDNHASRRHAEALGGIHTLTHRLYERETADGPAGDGEGRDGPRGVLP